jgi:hypothetical protein
MNTRTFLIREEPDGSWMIHYAAGENIYPVTVKNSAREMIARIMQLLDVGPVAPQIGPERVELDQP